MKLQAIVLAACTMLAVLARAEDRTIHIGDLYEDSGLNTSIPGAEALNPYMHEHAAAAMWADKGGVFEQGGIGCDCDSCDSGCDVGCDSACGCDSCGGCSKRSSCGPRWSFIGEALYLERRGTPRIPLLMAAPAFPIGTSRALVTSQDVKTRFKLGYRATVIRHGLFGGGSDLEVSYFQIDSFKARAVVGGPGNGIAFDRIIAPVATAGPTRFNFGSDIYSGEANLRRRINNRFTFLGGFRWIELGEGYLAQDTGGANPFYATDTNNHLYGGQFGVDMRAMGGENGSINIVAKGGVFGNYADQSSFQNYAPGFSATTGGSDFQTSLLWEAAVNCRIRMNELFFIQAGYQVMWLNGLALASEQVIHNDFANAYGGTLVNTGGSLFYHGGFLGLVGTW